jgi:hypothetical protein
MSVVNVIDMTFVFDRGVAAVRGVPVTVVGMDFEIAHKIGIQLTVVWLIPLKGATLLNHTHCNQPRGCVSIYTDRPPSVTSDGVRKPAALARFRIAVQVLYRLRSRPSRSRSKRIDAWNRSCPL